MSHSPRMSKTPSGVRTGVGVEVKRGLILRPSRFLALPSRSGLRTYHPRGATVGITKVRRLAIFLFQTISNVL